MDLCQACLNSLPVIEFACYSCGVCLPQNTQPLYCGRCLKKKPSVDQVLALCAYQEPVSWLLQSLKYQARLANAKVLASVWLNHFKDRIETMPDLIMPVPLHLKRLQDRGFNQAYELAKPLAAEFAVALSHQHCQRTVNTAKQTDLPAARRAKNVRNAFALKQPLSARRIALCDDVVTTGSTVNEIARILKKQGVLHVQVWSIARTCQAKSR